MEEDLHAPAGPGGPAIDARGADLPRRQPLRRARPRPQLRLERDLGRPGHHRHLRGASSATRTAASRPRTRTHYMWQGAVPAVRGPHPQHLLDAEPRRPHARRLRDADRRTARSSASSSRGRRSTASPYAYTQAPRHLQPRGRPLGARLRALQRAGEDEDASGLHELGVEDRLHLQLVLHQPQAHRLLQLGREPDPAQARRRRTCRRSGRRSSPGAASTPTSRSSRSTT